VSRNRALATYAAVTAATVALFVVIVAVRENTALVEALSAAGTVAAGVFAALAALGSMRAAADSSATARRSREALARTAQPAVRPEVRADGGTLVGEVLVEGQAAVAVTVVWMLVGREPATARADRIDPGVAGGLTVDLRLPPDAELASTLRMVWLEYRDAGRIGHWQDTWEITPDPRSPLRLADSSLAD
jgi:hypothetical protein